jgi:hypothetical protein
MSTSNIVRYLISFIAGLVFFNSVNAAELSGFVGAQLRWFYEEPVDSRQADIPVSINVEPEWYTDWNNRRDSFVFKPYLRLDSKDSERSHFDIREAYWLQVFNQWELGLGVSKVYWGVTESQHLVDIVNQTDLVEAPDGEEKLGQPMIRASAIRNWGIVDVFVLPGFRERTFPGEEGRLRPPLQVDVDHASYESSAEQNHVDFAARWSQSVGQWDMGLSGFWGTSRDPLFFDPVDVNGTLKLQPFYAQIQQYGVDLQVITGSWLWKLESIYRESSFEEFMALTGGFEYTFVGIFERIWDLGMLLEYSHDDRSAVKAGALQNDIFAGGRLAFNDVDSSEILFGVIQDLDYSDSRSGLIEVNTRVGSNIKLYLEGRFFESDDQRDAVYALRQDSLIEVSAEYYF